MKSIEGEREIMKKICLILISAMLLTTGICLADIVPPYCNTYEIGSSFTGSQVSMVTMANERHISSYADIPTTIGYSISLSGVGSASAWVNAHITEGRTGYMFDEINNNMGIYSPCFWNPDMGMGTPSNGFMQGVDMSYKEITTASGIIQSFSKTISIQY